MKIRKSSTTLLIFAIVLLPLSLSLELNFSMPVIGYADEIIALFMMLYVIFLMLKSRLTKTDSSMVITLVLFTMLGLISNVFSGLISNIAPILLDAFAQWKIFVGFMAAKYIAFRDYDNYILRSLVKLSKAILILGALCGIISIFADIGMAQYSADQRYGLPAYYFVFGNSGRYGIIVAVALLIVISCTGNKKQIRLYEALALLGILLTTKGVAYIIAVIYICLQFLFNSLEKKGKLNLKTIIPVGAVGILASGYQITAYLLDAKAPRMLLIKYGFITANKYFPLGSGFATYGSSEAAKNYSKLYVQYGWKNKWTMGVKNGDALNDNYLATIIGECGYLGLALFLTLFYNIFRQINSIVLNTKCKALLLSLFIDMVVCFIATGITKSSIGMLAFIIIGVFKGLDERKKVI